MLEPVSIERLLISGVLEKPLSSLYLHLTVSHDVKTTRMDIPSLEDEEWEECIPSFILSMIAAGDRFIQLKFLDRAY